MEMARSSTVDWDCIPIFQAVEHFCCRRHLRKLMEKKPCAREELGVNKHHKP